MVWCLGTRRARARLLLKPSIRTAANSSNRRCPTWLDAVINTASPHFSTPDIPCLNKDFHEGRVVSPRRTKNRCMGEKLYLRHPMIPWPHAGWLFVFPSGFPQFGVYRKHHSFTVFSSSKFKNYLQKIKFGATSACRALEVHVLWMALELQFFGSLTGQRLGAETNLWKNWDVEMSCAKVVQSIHQQKYGTFITVVTYFHPFQLWVLGFFWGSYFFGAKNKFLVGLTRRSQWLETPVFKRQAFTKTASFRRSPGSSPNKSFG